VVRPLFSEAAKRLGLIWHDILFLAPQEIVDSLKADTKADQTLIAMRKEYRVDILRVTA